METVKVEFHSACPDFFTIFGWTIGDVQFSDWIYVHGHSLVTLSDGGKNLAKVGGCHSGWNLKVGSHRFVFGDGSGNIIVDCGDGTAPFVGVRQSTSPVKIITCIGGVPSDIRTHDK